MAGRGHKGGLSGPEEDGLGHISLSDRLRGGKKAESTLAGDSIESVNTDAIALRVKVDNLQQARATLLALKEVSTTSV